MFTSLYSKIALGLAALFLVVGLIFIGVTVFSTDMYQQEVNQKLNRSLADQIVKEWLLMERGQVNTRALKEIFHMLMVINPGIEIYLLDTKGSILTYSAPKGSVKRQSVSLEPIKSWLSSPKKDQPVQGDDPKDLNRQKVFSAAPIMRGPNLEGYLYVILGGEQYDSVADKLKGSYIFRLSTWMIITGLFFTFISGLVIFALLTGRLKRLARVMDTFAADKTAKAIQLDAPLSTRAADEIDRLTLTFKNMSERIHQQMEALNVSDRMRRELVANVSHDLKTPLATLQGYIETLLIEENRQTPEQRREYLETAIKHCHRLNTLVSELLELAQVESAQYQITPEPFNLAELANDILHKFFLRANERQITLEPKFQDTNTFVFADIALIERAFENLIENALRHTPENGRVVVELITDPKIIVSVSDTGPGIPKDQIEHIFNRFHRTSGQTDTPHVGLGLAITRKIAELHGSILKVKSTPGKGTCFSFTLPSGEQ
ncbi:MAG: HAMP domain-containing histidine kinase [Desulfobacterales bacterium]|nr:HAMP domain-containing histidine kinase [Desulfobacterales bacterium]